jgi:predicted  nucleic acid-binding Zn-ribbon protein
LAAQLNVLKAENELALKRVNEFEIHLENLRSKNSELEEEVQKKSGKNFNPSTLI